MLPGKTLDDVEDFSRFWEDRMYEMDQEPPVLFLELEEDEKDPLVSIPTFITLHSSDVRKVLKTIVKSGSCEYLLVRPHEPDELLLMAKVMFEADPERLCAHLGCETEWDKVAKVVSDRMNFVGPLVRQVLSRQRAFDDYVEEMEEIASEAVSSAHISRLTKFNIPPALEYFVTPYPLVSDAVDPANPEKTYAFRFLSDHAAFLLADTTMDREFLIYAAANGLEYQFTETFLRTGLLRDLNAPTFWQKSSWEWHADPTYETNLSARTKVATPPPPKSCGRLVKFQEMHYEGDAQQLDGDTLYLSQTITFCMGEMFTVVKKKGRTVAINLFHTTTKSLSDRPFPVDTLHETMKRFGLFKPHNAHVTLHLIGVVDKSRVNVEGLKFVDNAKDMTVNELRRDYPEVGNRLKTFVVRAGIYNVDRTAMVSRPMATLARPDPVALLLAEKRPDLVAMARQWRIKRASNMKKAELAVRIRDASRKNAHF